MAKDAETTDGTTGRRESPAGGRGSSAAKAGAKAVGKAGGKPAARSGAGSRGAGSGGAGSGGAGSRAGRTRPPTQVVAKQRPWGLIAGAVAVVVFAVAVLGYAYYKVDEKNANAITSADQLEGIQTYEYAAGQNHVTTPVDYTESPPVGGPHDPEWADCTGTVYDVDIRHENAVHSMEHGAVWITYDPDTISDSDLSTLKDLVQGHSGLLLSPYAGLTSTISLQSWNHQVFLDSASDKRVQQYVDFFTFGTDSDGTSLYPEVGASCEMPGFITDPLVEGDSSRGDSGTVTTDAPTTPTDSTESAAPTTDAATTTTANTAG